MHSPATAGTLAFDPYSLAETLHNATSDWHQHNLQPEESPTLFSIALRLHKANFDLWHQEDLARDPHATDATITSTKRSIDTLNQRRNDLVEELDRTLLEAVQQNPAAPLHSETPGMMLDRLSILSLKRFHTAEQTSRPDVTEEHRKNSRLRLSQLDEQFADLAAALQHLWSEILHGTRRFKLYRQFKMYNDPTLNPILYNSSNPKQA
ncbi:DUF4254 domain-containing protein [Terriglobus saanensis]|nr:DUF4254 domain-containing protein [Terriglobus saanensis]